MRLSASPRSSLLAALIGCAALSACGSANDTASPPGDQASESSPSTPAVTASLSAADTRDLASPVAKTKISCSTQIGEKPAADLVNRCIVVSPATHPPCNAANSCALIESEIARGCALLGEDAAKESACGPDPRSGEAAVAAIERYYSALNARDYGTAWQVWGPDGSPEQTYDEFLKGYAQTDRTTVTVGTPDRVEGAAGSLYVTVPVTVDAQLDSGRRQHFTGSYTLRQRNIGTSQGWHIASAKLSPG